MEYKDCANRNDVHDWRENYYHDIPTEVSVEQRCEPPFTKKPKVPSSKEVTSKENKKESI